MSLKLLCEDGEAPPLPHPGQLGVSFAPFIQGLSQLSCALLVPLPEHTRAVGEERSFTLGPAPEACK